jgi:dTMP kinase
MQYSSHSNRFLTIEGIEGVGKSTAVKFIQSYLTRAQQKFIITREPGGTVLAEQIRKILLTPNADEIMTPKTELMLMFAARAQHISQCIQPALHAGKWVVSDRFVDASYAYQGGGRGFDVAQIKMLDEWVVGDFHPAVTILLDASPSLGLARAKRRGEQDRIEQEKIIFFERVRAAYLARAKADAKRFYVIDASQTLAAVHAEIKTILDKLLLDNRCDK